MAEKSGIVGDDSRLKKSTAPEMRGTRDSANENREHDGSILSPKERRRMLREGNVQEILPSVPEIQGFHVCWLSTTNSSDPIFRRMKLGYVPVKYDEVAGFEFYKATGGDFDGCIQCKEMVLFKIDYQTYIDLMTIYHHDMPNEEEESIKEKMLSSQGTDSTGRDLGMVEGDGINELGKSRNPIFH